MIREKLFFFEINVLEKGFSFLKIKIKKTMSIMVVRLIKQAKII